MKKKNNNNEKIYVNNFCNHRCYLVKLSRIPQKTQKEIYFFPRARALFGV